VDNLRCPGAGREPQRPEGTEAASPDNPELGVLIALLYEDLVEVEALAVTADQAVTQLPPRPPGRHGRTLARLYTLVGKTSGRAQGALERGEELVALRAARLPRPGRGPRRSPGFGSTTSGRQSTGSRSAGGA